MDASDHFRIRNSVAVYEFVTKRGVRGAHGNNAGGTRFFVACSNAYPNRKSVGSLHALPVKLTPKGTGFALNVAGNAGVGAFGTVA
jgi:hypothetical protein